MQKEGQGRQCRGAQASHLPGRPAPGSWPPCTSGFWDPMGPPRMVHVIRQTGISGRGARETEEKRDILRKYEMRWGVNEVEAQEGGSRWQEKHLCRGGEGRGPAGWQGIAGVLPGALFTVFQPRGKILQPGSANTRQTQAWCGGARHCWRLALDVPGKGCKSKKKLSLTLSSSSTVFTAGHTAWPLRRWERRLGTPPDPALKGTMSLPGWVTFSLSALALEILKCKV